MKQHKTILLLATILLPLCLCAQKQNFEVDHKRWTIGIGGGYRVNFMKFTNIYPTIIDKTPYAPYTHSDYVFSLFGYKEFDKKGHFALRPQFSYLRRGAMYRFYTLRLDYYRYSLFAGYADFRLPIIINLTAYNRDKKLQPYAYVSPILGLVTDGEIVTTYDEKTTMKLTKANIAKFYFGIGAALGCRYNIVVRTRNFFVGLEAMYDHGITNTYSKKEKDGRANDIGKLVDYHNEPLTGERLLKGIEFQAVVGIPLGRDHYYPSQRKRYRPYIPKQTTPPVEVVEETKTPIDTVKVDAQEEPQPEIEVVETKPTLHSVTFAFGSAVLSPDARAYLNTVAQMLKNNGARIKIIGHTDSKGSYAYNLKLSRDRAKSVMDYLIKQGVAKDQITTDGFGANRPAADNATEQGRAQNRRVDLEIE